MLNDKLQLARFNDSIRTKSLVIDLGEEKIEHLKIRVPLKRELEELNASILTPPKERVDAIFEALAAPLKKVIEEGGDEFLKALNENGQSIVFKGEDIIVDGNSLLQLAQFRAIEQVRVERYFALLVSETEEPINESYDQICAEYPEFFVNAIVSSIQEALSPNYNVLKKN